MLKIAICDDNFSDCEIIRKYFYKYWGNHISFIEDYSDGAELIAAIKAGDYFDIVFLDYKMNTCDGITTASLIRQQGHMLNSAIIFISAFSNPAEKVIDVHPYAYLIKPITEDIFFKKIEPLIDLLKRPDFLIELPIKNYKTRIHPESIYYAKIEAHNCIIRLSDSSIKCRISLNKLSKILSAHSDYFVRINSSYIINMRYLSSVEPGSVILKNNETLPVSRTYQKDLLEKVRELLIK